MKHSFLVVALSIFVCGWQTVPAWHSHDVADHDHHCHTHSEDGSHDNADHGEGSGSEHDEEHCPVCRLAFVPLGDVPADVVVSMARVARTRIESPTQDPTLPSLSRPHAARAPPACS